VAMRRDEPDSRYGFLLVGPALSKRITIEWHQQLYCSSCLVVSFWTMASGGMCVRPEVHVQFVAGGSLLFRDTCVSSQMSRTTSNLKPNRQGLWFLGMIDRLRKPLE
jgi:hypothetical protein